MPAPSTFNTPEGRVFNPQYQPLQQLQQQPTNVTVRHIFTSLLCLLHFALQYTITDR